MDGGDTADVLLKLMKQDISVTLLVLWCSWNFPKHWISNSSRLYSSPYKLFVEKNEGFTLLFVLPFAFEDHVSFLGCCTEWHWVSAQFWPILKPPSTCLFMCMYNVVVLQFIDPSLVRCASDSQGNLLLQIIPRPNLYMTARNLSKLLLMCLWWDADSSTIILPADLDLDFFGTHWISPHSSCFFHLCLVLSDLWHQQFPHCIAQSLLQSPDSKKHHFKLQKVLLIQALTLISVGFWVMTNKKPELSEQIPGSFKSSLGHRSGRCDGPSRGGGSFSRCETEQGGPEHHCSLNIIPRNVQLSLSVQ